MIWSIIGAILAVIFVLLALKTKQPRFIFAIGLFLTALIYLILAFLGNSSLAWKAIEFFGLAVFTLFAWLGMTSSVWWLSLGWAIHTIWDFALHTINQGSEYTPDWYPWLCIGFDLVVAISIIMIRKYLPSQIN